MYFDGYIRPTFIIIDCLSLIFFNKNILKSNCISNSIGKKYSRDVLACVASDSAQIIARKIKTLTETLATQAWDVLKLFKTFTVYVLPQIKILAFRGLIRKQWWKRSCSCFKHYILWRSWEEIIESKTEVSMHTIGGTRHEI